MPESALLGARVSVENLSDVVSREFVFFLLCLLIKNQQEIAGQHVIKRINRSVDGAFVIYMQIDPGLNMIQIALVPGSEIDQVDTV